MAEILDMSELSRAPSGATSAAPELPADPAEQVLALVRLRAKRRAAWLGALRERCGAAASAGAYTLALSGEDAPLAEAEWFAATPGLAHVNAEIAALQERLAEPASPVSQLIELLSLEPSERGLVLTCWAHALDPDLGDVFAHLQHGAHRRYPTASLVARLFGQGRAQLWRASSPAAVWHVVQARESSPGEAAPLELDPVIAAWLGGRVVPDPCFVGVVRNVQAPSELPSWRVDEAAEAIARIGRGAGCVRQVMVGAPGTGRRSFAAALATRFGLEAICVDADAIDDARFAETYVRLQRSAALAGLAPVWHGAKVGRAWPQVVGPAPLSFVVVEDEDELGSAPGCVDNFTVVPAPNLDERRALWRGYVPSAQAWPPGELESLAARHRLTVADIANVGARAPTTIASASEMAREATRHRLGELGKLLPSPFDWEDLVLASTLRQRLEAFAFEANDRAAFWEDARARRLFPRGTGLVGLMSGTPGTGKTMAAQVIARDLGLDLFRIDLATVVSKYIGETAKNLKRVFSRAARMSAVLLFDEADALFSKRTDVKDSHDRYANADTNYLLQLLEDYRGVALLATNKRNNIDPAFIRRVRYVFEFRRPDAKQRLGIWRKIVGEMAGDAAARKLAVPLEGMANTVEVSGAQIKNGVLAGMFMARRRGETLGVKDLLGGLDLELEKEGRALTGRQKELLLRHG